MDDVWAERFASLGPSLFPVQPKYFRYYQYHGTDEFRCRIASFMTTFFKPSPSYGGAIRASDVREQINDIQIVILKLRLVFHHHQQ